MFERTPDVLIVGAGPVGLYAALALAWRDVPVQIVDTGIWACTHSYALALHRRSLKLLQDVGLLERALESAYQVRKLALYDNSSRRAEIRLDNNADPMTCVAVLRQDVLETLLEEALANYGVRVSWRHQVSEIDPQRDHVLAAVDKYERESRGYVVAHTEWVVSKTTRMEVPFVIGADGYKSKVRQALKIEFPEVGPAQYYAVFEFKSDADLGHELRVVLGDKTTDVLWPLPNGYCRWSFELPDYTSLSAEDWKRYLLESGQGDLPSTRVKDRSLGADGEDTALLDEPHLRALIHTRAPWFKGSIEDLTWRTIVRFERRLASSFGRERMWLAGDAAHLAGPAGIQSMNLGLFEAHDLSETLTRVLHRVGSASLLEAYNERWLAEWRRLQGLEGGLHAESQTDPWINKNAARLTSCLPAHGAEMASLADQVNLHL
jgi:2-polyprenyl-6-methoxyphenol hydroxylase-like FAD-dependent oxidoreductase